MTVSSHQVIDGYVLFLIFFYIIFHPKSVSGIFKLLDFLIIIVKKILKKENFLLSCLCFRNIVEFFLYLPVSCGWDGFWKMKSGFHQSSCIIFHGWKIQSRQRFLIKLVLIINGSYLYRFYKVFSWKFVTIIVAIQKITKIFRWYHDYLYK